MNWMRIWRRYRLEDLKQGISPSELRTRTRIALIDDEPFRRLDPLIRNGFNIVEVGGNVTSLEQVAAYPVVVCDIRGVAGALNVDLGGAHLIAEIRKAYPDKYLIAYSGVAQSIRYNEFLSRADRSLTKGAPIEEWVTALDKALEETGTPYGRWMRFRQHLCSTGLDALELHQLEQAYIAASLRNNPALLERHAQRLPPDIQDLALRFAQTALIGLISGGSS